MKYNGNIKNIENEIHHKIFIGIDPGKNGGVAIINEIPWFYDLTTWEEYCKLIISGHVKELNRPYGFVTGHINIGENDSE